MAILRSSLFADNSSFGTSWASGSPSKASSDIRFRILTSGYDATVDVSIGEVGKHHVHYHAENLMIQY